MGLGDGLKGLKRGQLKCAESDEVSAPELTSRMSVPIDVS
jgi:hypothetical protein